MALLSVIIPVYNTEKYIAKCLNSIVRQEIKDIEIIIVNDCSEDNSKSIIKNWIENNKRIDVKYLEKENGGLSDARNYGLEHSNGKYISFIDSDDYIDEHLFGNLVKYMDEDIDLIKFKMRTVNEDGKILERLDGPVFEKCTGEEAFQKLCFNDKFIDPACIYLYKKDFFIKNKFKYTVGTYHEDFGLTPLIIINANSFISTNEMGYNYLKRTNSITVKQNLETEVKKANDLLSHYDNMLKKINRYKISSKTNYLVKQYYTNTIVLKAGELLKDTKEFNNYIKELKKRKIYRNIRPNNFKQIIKRCLLHYNIKLYLKIR